MDEVFQAEDSFYIELADSEKAFLKYYVKEGKMFVFSTYTPPRHRRKGVAARFMEEAVKIALKKGLKIVPICSYAKHYLEKHPELKDLFVQ